jgi:hypothetical protein
MRNTIKVALAATAGVAALAVATPSEAHWSRHHHRGQHVRIIDGYGSYGAYGYGGGYVGGYGAYAYEPGYSWSASDRNERNCMRSPASIHYVPCLNKP